MTTKEIGEEGWVWDPDVTLVNYDSEGVEIDMEFTVRIFSGRFEAEYAWVHRLEEGRIVGTAGIAVFRDWNKDNIPVLSPQWRANGEGGVDIPGTPGNEYEPKRGARLIATSSREYQYAEQLLHAAYELDS